MKSLPKGIAVLVIGRATSISAAEEDKRIKEVADLSSAFWSAVTAGKVPEAKKSLFVKEDDPEIASPDLISRRVAEEFEKLTARVKEMGQEESDGHRFGEIKEIKVEKIEEQGGRTVGAVTLMVWEPREKEFEKVNITWFKTSKSGWKLIDL